MPAFRARRYVRGMKKQGTFLGAPYNWTRPTWAKTKRELWDPANPRLVVPRQFGWGYAINFARLFRRR